MKSTRIIALTAFTGFAVLVNSVQAQTALQVNENAAVSGGHPTTAVAGGDIHGRIETRVVPETKVLPSPPAPKLGFIGQIVYGMGMKVLNVTPGSPASNAGLEYGDIILSANGRQIRQPGDLSRALSDAATYRGGTVNLFVKNVRGTAYQGNEYVNVTAHLFGRPVPMALSTSGPIVEN